MNLLILITISVLLIVLLCVAFANKNIWGAVGAGILSIFLGYIIFVGGSSVQKEECEFLINETKIMEQSVSNTVLTVTTTNTNRTEIPTYKKLCLNETIVPNGSVTENLVFNGVALLLLIISIGLIFGTGINRE